MATAAGDTTTLWLVRHGDRFDYANQEEWNRAAIKQGFERRDPPLSAIGHQQAREAAAALAQLCAEPDCVLASPYLRVLQTAQPFAHAVQRPILVEEGLAEVRHVQGAIDPPGRRFRYLPEVSLEYEPQVVAESATTEARTGRPMEAYPHGYFRRMRRMAAHVARAYRGRSVVAFSHAASVALVAALTGEPLDRVGAFAPCGIFKVVAQGDGPWRVELYGADNTGHVSCNTPTTYPWGFQHSGITPSPQAVWDAVGTEGDAPAAAGGQDADEDMSG